MKTNIAILILVICSITGFSKNWTVTNAGMTFSPSALTISQGDSVNFVLSSFHNAVEVDQSTWDANGNTPLPGGFSVPFGGGEVLPANLGIGIHYYVCHTHASLGMKGTITVNAGNPAVVFQSTYGTMDGHSDFSGAAIQQTPDGGFIATGYVSNFGAGADDIYLLKTGPTGSIQWTKTFGGALADDGNAIVQTTDGGYAIAGVTLSFGGEKISLIKTDATGTVMWSMVYGTGTNASDASASSLQQTSDGGYILAGYISNYGAGADDYYLVKTDANGVLQWTKTYGGTGNDDASSVAQTPDGGFIVVGTSTSFGDTLGNIYVVRTDATGTNLWSKTYGSNLGDATDKANSVRVTSDNGFLIAGVTISTSAGEFARLIKTDMNGNIQWTKLFGTTSSASDASFAYADQTSDGGYIATGYISNFGGGGDDYFLVRTNAAGDTLWTRTYGTILNEDANFVKQNSDGGFIVAGVSANVISGEEFLMTVRTDPGGNTSCLQYPTQTYVNTSITTNTNNVVTTMASGGIAENAPMSVAGGGTLLNTCALFGISESNNPANSITAFPNPASSQVTFESPTDLSNAILQIYNTTGARVKQVSFSGREIVLSRSDLGSGIYFYRVLKNNEPIGAGKIVME